MESQIQQRASLILAHLQQNGRQRQENPQMASQLVHNDSVSNKVEGEKGYLRLSSDLHVCHGGVPALTHMEIF